MKAAITILILGLIFMHGEALKCRQSACSGTGSCTSREMTCRGDADQCFSLIQTIGYRVSLTRGCITSANCMILKATFPQTNCCKTELCN